MSKTSDYKYYLGDYNLEYGGTFYNLEDWKHGYVSALRVIDLDSGCGFNGAVYIELITIITDEPSKIWDSRRLCGFDNNYSLPGRDSDTRKMIIANCLELYGYYDPDDSYYHYQKPHKMIIQTESDEWEGYYPMEWDGWKADIRLPEDKSLLEYLEDEGYLNQFE